MPDALPYTDELLAKVTETLAAYRRAHGPMDIGGIDTSRLAIGLLNNGVGLVDTSRKAFLVDLDVYQGSQARQRTLEARIAELEAELARTVGLARDMTNVETAAGPDCPPQVLAPSALAPESSN